MRLSGLLLTALWVALVPASMAQPSSPSPCGNPVCIAAVVGADSSVSLRATNVSGHVREVGLVLSQVHGYALDRPEPLVAEIASDETREMVVLRRSGVEPPFYRYVSTWQTPYRIGCAAGVCVRASQSRGGATVDVHNLLSIPVLAEVEVGGVRTGPLRTPPGKSEP